MTKKKRIQKNKRDINTKYIKERIFYVIQMTMKEKQEPKQRSPWLVIISILLVLTVFSFFVVGCVSILVVSNGVLETGNVAVIPIKGVIMIEQDSDLFSATTMSATEIIEQIEKAQKDPAIQAIVLDINSPGGGPVASAEIARAITEANKTTVAVIREVGASGAYWAASAADHVIANEVSVTGSIGVIGSYLMYGDLLERYNVSYERFIAGKYKDMGSPYREMSAEEKALYQTLLDKMRGVFIRAVAENRKLEYDYIQTLATGQVYLGSEALQLGLIDELGGKKEAYSYIEKKLGITVEPVKYEKEKSFFELLAEALDNTAFSVGTGIGNALVEEEETGIRAALE